MKVKEIIKTYLPIAALAVLTLLIFHHFFYFIFVTGDSMNPTYHDGDILWCRTVHGTGDVEVGDVVVVKINHLDYIKRVVGCPGDKVVILGNGELFVNGIRSGYQYDMIKNPGIADKVISLKDGEYFLLGDNRNHSKDSREFGSVGIDSIICRAEKTIYKAKEK